jgi:hypothetical protein
MSQQQNEDNYQLFKLSKVATRSTFQPKLHFLDIFITHAHKEIQTKALIDSGCAKTAMSMNFYNKLPYKPTLQKKNSIHIQTCDGTTHGINGTTLINLTIGKQKLFQVTMDIMVVHNLADDLLLGLDFLSSTFVQKITPTAIYLKCQDKTICEKFIETTYPTMAISVSNKIQIPPNEHRIVTEQIAGIHSMTSTFTATPEPNRLITIDSFPEADGHVTIKLTNKTDQTVYANPSDSLLTITKTEVIVEEGSEEPYYKPPITSYIENRNMITEADLIVVPNNITERDYINMFDLKHFDKTDKEYLINILLRTKPAFSMHKYDIGRTHLIEMDIELNGNHTRIQKMIPMPLHVRDRAKEILDQMKHYGIIRECNEPSPYCSNILVIPKKDNVNVRLLFDGRLLNYDTVRYPMALFSKPEILAELVNKRHLSSLDVADAFYQIPLTKRAQPLTAFYSYTHGLRMCFNRAPQGLRNSPLYLKILLDMVFKDMQHQVLYYADDLLIATDGTMKHHLDTIDEVLHRLIKAGLKLRPQKLLLARQSIEFLGMIFEKGTVNIPSLRLETFRNTPTPTTAKKLKSALCAFSYYRHFVPNYAELTNDLMTLANGPPKKFKFTPANEKDFRQIIETICNHSKTYFPDKNLPFYVQTDASKLCAGGRIFQKKIIDNEPQEMLIAAVSKTFTSTERNYSIYKKEALALLYTLRAMDFYLRFAPKLIILIDAKALTFLRLAKDSSDILLRFSLEISKYEAEIHHIPGKENVVSDYLSRQHKDIPAIEADIQANKTISVKDTLQIIDALTFPTDFTLTKSQLFNLLNGPSPYDDTNHRAPTKSKAQEGPKKIKNTPTTLHNRKIKMPRTTNSIYRPGVLLSANALTRSKTSKQNLPGLIDTTDEPFHQPDTSINQPIEEPVQTPTDIEDYNSTVINYSDIGFQTKLLDKGLLTPAQFYLAQMSDPYIQNLLQRKHQTRLTNGYLEIYQQDKWKPILPTSLAVTLINILHFHRPGIHKSKQQITRDVTNLYFIPTHILKDTLHKLIADCHICQLYDSTKQNHTMNTLQRYNSPRLSWSVDLVTDLPVSKNGFKILIIAVDDFANYIVAIPIKTTTTEDIKNGLTNHIFTPFGHPKRIRTDEQPGIYNSTDFYQYLTSLDIELNATAVGSPFSNGRAERTIGIFKQAARKYFYQYKCLDNWDEHLTYIINALNSSINIYGYTPEQIMFGSNSKQDYVLLDIPHNNTTHTPEDTITNIIDKAQTLRERYNTNKQKKEQSNLTYKNKELQSKKFCKGDLVLHRQLQVSTGSSSKWKPLYTGPYSIVAIHPNDHTATCQHTQSGRIIKCHFSNLTVYRYNEHTLMTQKSNADEHPLYKT